MQFVAFGNPCPRTNQLLYRRRKYFACVTTVGKDFLHRARIIPLTFQCHQAAFSIRDIRRRHRNGMRQTLCINRYMPLDAAHFLAGIVAFFMAVSVFFTLCASTIRKVVSSWRPRLRRAAAT